MSEEKELDLESMEKAAGGKIAKNPNGSIETLDKYVVVDDNTNAAIAKTGGYRHARKIAEKMGLSTDDMPYEDIKKP